METMGPTQARNLVPNGSLLFQFRIHGKPKGSWMSYKVNTFGHIHHRSNLGNFFNLHGKGRVILELVRHLDQITYLYDKNDEDAMTPMTQIRSEGWYLTYLTCQVKIEHPRGFSCEFGKLNGFLLKLGEDGRLGKGGHMENLDPRPNSNWLEFLDGLVKLEG